jgi:hypothetical protein
MSSENVLVKLKVESHSFPEIISARMEIAFHKLWHNYKSKVKSKSKAIPVTGLGGLYSCEMLRIPYFLDNWLAFGGKVRCKAMPVIGLGGL